MYFQRIRKRLLAGAVQDRVSAGLRSEVSDYLAACSVTENRMDWVPPEHIWPTIEESKRARSALIEIDQSALDDHSTRLKVRVVADHVSPGDALLCLGDNDMLAVALSYHPWLAAITVVDVDKRVLEDVGQLAETSALSLVEADLRYIGPLEGVFQLVVCDPPYTSEGFRLYLKHAVQVLEVGGELLLTYPDMELESWNYDVKLGLQEALSEGGLVIEAIEKRSQTFDDRYGIVASLLVARKVASGAIEGDINEQRIYTVR